MLAIHYCIPLADAESLAAVRRRVAERGRLFDGMEGLAHKFFLIDPVQPTYATYYLWRDSEAALRFLNGPFFAAVVESFGRPKVRLLLPQSVLLPEDAPRSAWLVHAEAEAMPAAPRQPRIDALDPASGEYLSLAFTGDWPGRRFDVAYHARGSAALDRTRMRDAVSFVSL